MAILPPDKEILPGKKAERVLFSSKYTDINRCISKKPSAGLGGNTNVEPVVKFNLMQMVRKNFMN